MNILIIGGAGYIGSHVAQEILDQGYRVTVYDNLSSGLRENLVSLASSGAATSFIHADILNYTDLVKAMKREEFNAIIHLAAFKAAGESMLKPDKYSRNNIIGTLNILNAAVETGIKKIVFSSSAAVYGEPKYIPIDENHLTKPENFYGFTKLEIERFLSWYDKLKKIRYASLRYFNAAGYDVKGVIKGLEQNPANLIPVVMETACGMREEMKIFGNDYATPDGTCIRDYIHVSDLASAHVAALKYINKNDKSLTVNLGSGKGVSVTEVVEAARRITGARIPATVVGRRPGDPAQLTASSNLARELLKWKAQRSDLDTLIQTSWKVYQEQTGVKK